jgi:hypothetical protein
MIAKRKLIGVACLIVALVGIGVVLAPGPDASSLLRHYVFSRVPDSLKMLEFEKHGFREWTAFFHFKMASEDFPKLLQDNNPVLVDPVRLESEDRAFASLALQIFKKHLPDADFAKSYEMYILQRTNAVTVNYLVVNMEHSEGFVVIIRY